MRYNNHNETAYYGLPTKSRRCYKSSLDGYTLYNRYFKSKWSQIIQCKVTTDIMMESKTSNIDPLIFDKNKKYLYNTSELRLNISL